MARSMTAQDDPETDLVLSETRGATVILTLNEPARMNPLSHVRRERLIALLRAAHDDPAIRSIVLTGAGGNFSTGADVRDMDQPDGPDLRRSQRRLDSLHTCARLIAAGPKPVLAAIEGVAFGAGLSLALACDFVVAAPRARFGSAFGKLGLAPDLALMWSLPQRVGMRQARDILFTGRHIRADEAVQTGIADALAPEGEALAAALAKAETYHAIAPFSLAVMKAGFADGPLNVEAALKTEIHVQPLLRTTRDHAEGRAAFMEKRQPRFTGQ